MSTLAVIKSLADETRLRVVGLLEHAGSLCACEIETLLGLNQSNASRHLARLREAGVVNAVREGHWVHYSYADSSPTASIIRELLTAARAEDPTLRADMRRLLDYQSSEYSCETISGWADRQGS